MSDQAVEQVIESNAVNEQNKQNNQQQQETCESSLIVATIPIKPTITPRSLIVAAIGKDEAKVLETPPGKVVETPPGKVIEIPPGKVVETETTLLTQKFPLPPKTTVESESQTEDEISEDQVKKAATILLQQAAYTPQQQQQQQQQQKQTQQLPEQLSAKQTVVIPLPMPPIKVVNNNENDTNTFGGSRKNPSLQNMDICSEYLVEAEQSLIEIKEKITEGRDLQNVPLADSESEEDDQLKPLMIDNHTIVDHQEFFNYNATPFYPNGIKDSGSSTDSDNSSITFKRKISPIQQQQQQYQQHEQQQQQQQQQQHQQQQQQQYQQQPEQHHQQQHQLFQQIGQNNSDIPYFEEITIKDPRNCYNMKSTPDIKEIDTLTPDEIPDERICEEIVEHVEYYFSNESILKDAFLLKHVRRNKEGYVSLKLVSSFKRVRQLTKDWRVVGYAIRRKSRKIELNDLCTKIRRIEPLPTFDETMPSRTIVACDLPFEKLSIEKVTEIFSKCGEIALVRILKPGMGIPVDVRQFMNKYPELQQKECALVEFIESQSARNARNMNGNFQVYEMVAPKKKTGKKAQTVTKIIETYKYPESMNYERNRGGIIGSPTENEMKYKMRRNSDYYMKDQQYQHHQHQQHQQHFIYNPARSHSFNNNNNNNNSNNNNNNDINNFGHYSPRRISNCSLSSSDMSRKYSSCSEGYSSCSDMSRRTSGCSISDQSRRTSNCSDICPCSRRMSACSDVYRRMSQCSPDHRRYSSSAVPYDRSMSNPVQDLEQRRISMDSNYERKISTGSMNGNGGNGGGGGGGQINIHDPYRKFSNGFDPNRKLSNQSDQYYNGRRISTDSGYDRKLSFGSDYGTSPRSRSNSFLMCQHKTVDNVVRTPIGPDGSKGFTSRARKLGQIVTSVN